MLRHGVIDIGSSHGSYTWNLKHKISVFKSNLVHYDKPKYYCIVSFARIFNDGSFVPINVSGLCNLGLDPFGETRLPKQMIK